MAAERIDTAAVLAGVDIVELVSRYVAVKPAGSGEYLCLCPFHADNNPSCRIIPKKGFIYCHSCQWAGNAIDFVMEYTGAPFIAAVDSMRGGNLAAGEPTKRPSISPDTSVDWQPVVPVPTSAPQMNPSDIWNPKRDRAVNFQPTAIYPYRDAAGALLGYVLRIDFADGKITPQVTYCTHVDTGEQRWCLATMPRPGPLYGLERLAAKPHAKILLTEGERCADVAQSIWPGMAVMSWPGGVGGARHADWSPLAGRDIVLWPDHDQKLVKTDSQSIEYGVAIGDLIPWDQQPGQRCMHTIAVGLLAAGCTLRMVNTSKDDHADGWDVADALYEDHMAIDEIKAWAKQRIVPYEPPHSLEEKKPPAAAKKQSDTAAEYSNGVDRKIAEDSSTSESPEVEQNDQTPSSRSSTERRTLRGPRGVELGVVDGNTVRKPKSKQKPELSPLTASHMSWDELGLDRAPGKVPHCNIDNVTRILDKHPALSGHIWYDEFLQTIITDVGGTTEEWSEVHEIRTTIWMQRTLSLPKMSESTVSRACLAYAHSNKKNEAKEYMISQIWDGTQRLESLLSAGFGTTHSPYTQAIGRCFIVGMVARVMDPGCKCDNMPVFEGGQGAFKSTAMNVLGGKWFTECHESVTSKDFYQVMRGKLLIEIAEMHSFSRHDIKRVKGVISCKVDNYRNSYGRRAYDHPRQGVFTGTTNENDWNEDDTGARRFWPVACGAIDVDWLIKNRDQLFAEAVHLYRLVAIDARKQDRVDAGAAWWDVPSEQAKQEQDARRPEDAINDQVEKWLKYHSRPQVTISEVLEGALELEPADFTQAIQTRVRRALGSLGWKSEPKYDPLIGKSRRFWVPINPYIRERIEKF